MGNRGLCEPEMTEEVDVERGAGGAFADGFERLERRLDERAVHERVQRTEFRDRRGDEVVALLWIGDVGRDAQRLSARGTDLVGDRVEFRTRACGERDRRALGRERERDVAAQPGPDARHDRNPAFEQHRLSVLVSWVSWVSWVLSSSSCASGGMFVN